MRTFLILALTLGMAYAGVRELSPNEEAEALDLFKRLCNGGGYSGGGVGDGQDIGGTRVYCKRASGEINQSQNHRVNVPGQSGQAQTVFIQPPPARYHHNVEIVSEGGQGGQTKIYVLPQQATHTITPNVQQQPGSQTKPVVYFLKGGNNGGSNSLRLDSGYGAPAPAPPPQLPQPVLRSDYGAPELNLGGYSRVARSSNDVVPANYRDYPITIENV